MVFRYSDGTPMAGAAFEVFAPDEAAGASRGVTDLSGEVGFHAGRDGQWRIDVDDGRGHLSRARIEVVRGLPSAARSVPIWLTTASLALNILLVSEFVRRWRDSGWRTAPGRQAIAT